MSYYIIPSPEEYIQCLKYKFDLAKKDKDKFECAKQLNYAKDFTHAIKKSVGYHQNRLSGEDLRGKG